MRLRTMTVGALALVACSGSSKKSGFSDGMDPNGDGGVGVFGDSGPGGGPSGKTVFYAHTDTTLYQIDPENVSAAPVMIGMFDCVSVMTDLGVTKDGKLFGVSQKGAYPLVIQGSTVHCDAMWPLPTGSNFYGLTVAPENTVAAAEVLVAANDKGQLFQIDANTGATTQLGTLGTDSATGLPWSLSGDIVFLANAGAPIGFATVRTCTGSGGRSCSTVDTLIEVDVGKVKPGTQSVLKSVRGQVSKGGWCTNGSSPATFGSMFGIAAYGDKVYGFSRKGDFVEIHNSDGSGCLVNAYPNLAFAGAGVTTVAPVVAPPK